MRILICDKCGARKLVEEKTSYQEGWKIDNNFVECVSCRLDELEGEKNKPTVDITKEEIWKMLYELGKYKLRQSTRDFTDSLTEQLDNGEKPTRKQIELLMKIKKEYDKWHDENKLSISVPE